MSCDHLRTHNAQPLTKSVIACLSMNQWTMSNAVEHSTKKLYISIDTKYVFHLDKQNNKVVEKIFSFIQFSHYNWRDNDLFHRFYSVHNAIEYFTFFCCSVSISYTIRSPELRFDLYNCVVFHFSLVHDFFFFFVVVV